MLNPVTVDVDYVVVVFKGKDSWHKYHAQSYKMALDYMEAWFDFGYKLARLYRTIKIDSEVISQRL